MADLPTLKAENSTFELLGDRQRVG